MASVYASMGLIGVVFVVGASPRARARVRGLRASERVSECTAPGAAAVLTASSSCVPPSSPVCAGAKDIMLGTNRKTLPT